MTSSSEDVQYIEDGTLTVIDIEIVSHDGVKVIEPHAAVGH